MERSLLSLRAAKCGSDRHLPQIGIKRDRLYVDCLSPLVEIEKLSSGLLSDMLQHLLTNRRSKRSSSSHTLLAGVSAAKPSSHNLLDHIYAPQVRRVIRTLGAAGLMFSLTFNAANAAEFCTDWTAFMTNFQSTPEPVLDELMVKNKIGVVEELNDVGREARQDNSLSFAMITGGKLLSSPVACGYALPTAREWKAGYIPDSRADVDLWAHCAPILRYQADEGSATAALLVGYKALVESDWAKARTYLEQASALDLPETLPLLAEVYGNEKSTVRDEEKATRFRAKATERGAPIDGIFSKGPGFLMKWVIADGCRRGAWQEASRTLIAAAHGKIDGNARP